uniref:Uncharacterized protein n=1 Tax=Parascaris univalens TaxID=6257 RepID=A0A915AMZ5_PARUN
MTSKQEDNNRKLLEELNRTRQLMMKSTSSSSRATTEASTLRCDPRTVQLVNNLEMQCPITFLPTNSQYNNTILPVFPRILPAS